MSDKRLRFALMLALLGGLVILLPGTRVVSGAPAAPHVYVRTDGNDSDCNGTADAAYPGSGTGLNCAFATVQKGAGSVSTGGTVHVAAGTYTETVAISQDLTLQGAGVDLTIVDGDASDTVLVCAGGYMSSVKTSWKRHSTLTST
jgi:pectin methylesterase-like acyl-CoA thioesterase